MMHCFPCFKPRTDDRLGEGPVTVQYTILGDREGGLGIEIVKCTAQARTRNFVEYSSMSGKTAHMPLGGRIAHSRTLVAATRWNPMRHLFVVYRRKIRQDNRGTRA